MVGRCSLLSFWEEVAQPGWCSWLDRLNSFLPLVLVLAGLSQQGSPPASPELHHQVNIWLPPASCCAVLILFDCSKGLKPVGESLTFYYSHFAIC